MKISGHIKGGVLIVSKTGAGIDDGMKYPLFGSMEGTTKEQMSSVVPFILL
jgi:hypothetical protein